MQQLRFKYSQEICRRRHSGVHANHYVGFSTEECVRRLKEHLDKDEWRLLSMEKTEAVDPSTDYGDEVNQMIEEMLGDQNAVRLGTYYSYKPN